MEASVNRIPLQVEQAAAAWYPLQCKPWQNFRAEENLRNQGYCCFHPVQPAARIKHDERMQAQKPKSLPGYLFIQLDKLADNWRPIRSTLGVNRLVTFNDQPLPVAADLIGVLRARTAAITVPSPQQASDPIKVIHGAFAELEAIFQSLSGCGNRTCRVLGFLLASRFARAYRDLQSL